MNVDIARLFSITIAEDGYCSTHTSLRAGELRGDVKAPSLSQRGLGVLKPSRLRVGRQTAMQNEVARWLGEKETHTAPSCQRWVIIYSSQPKEPSTRLPKH